MAKKKPAKKKNGKWFVLMTLGAIAIVTLMFMYGEPAPRYIPQQLIGTWRTTDSVYGDRFIEFSPATISFGTGAATISKTGFMKEVKTDSEDGKTLYTFLYEQDGAEVQLSFYYDGPDGEGIRLKNKKSVLWTKEKDN